MTRVDLKLGDSDGVAVATIEPRGSEFLEGGEAVSVGDLIELAALELELTGEPRPFTFTLVKGRRSVTFDWDAAKIELVERAIRLLARM